jgi:outer membrane immunogenic protein
MKTRLLAASAIFALTMPLAAHAADLRMPVKAPPAPEVAPAPSWTGFYIGGHIGYGWDSIDTNAFNSAGVLVDSVHHERQGILGGGQIGVNWTFANSWLLGAEADFSGADINGSLTACSATGCSHSTGKTDELATVRGRLGFIWNNALFYGTGGWAWSHSSTDRTIICVVAGGGVCPGGPSPSPLTGMTASASGTQSGWAAGGGIEYMFTPHWTFKVEYLHYQFDNVARDFNYPGFPTAFRHDVSNSSDDTIRFGVNYLFNFGGAPLATRY